MLLMLVLSDALELVYSACKVWLKMGLNHT